MVVLILFNLKKFLKKVVIRIYYNLGLLLRADMLNINQDFLCSKELLQRFLIEKIEAELNIKTH